MRTNIILNFLSNFCNGNKMFLHFIWLQLERGQVMETVKKTHQATRQVDIVMCIVQHMLATVDIVMCNVQHMLSTVDIVMCSVQHILSTVDIVMCYVQHTLLTWTLANTLRSDIVIDIDISYNFMDSAQELSGLTKNTMLAL